MKMGKMTRSEIKASLEASLIAKQKASTSPVEKEWFAIQLKHLDTMNPFRLWDEQKDFLDRTGKVFSSSFLKEIAEAAGTSEEVAEKALSYITDHEVLWSILKDKNANVIARQAAFAAIDDNEKLADFALENIDFAKPALQKINDRSFRTELLRLLPSVDWHSKEQSSPKNLDLRVRILRELDDWDSLKTLLEDWYEHFHWDKFPGGNDHNLPMIGALLHRIQDLWTLQFTKKLLKKISHIMRTDSEYVSGYHMTKEMMICLGTLNHDQDIEKLYSEIIEFYQEFSRKVFNRWLEGMQAPVDQFFPEDTKDLIRRLYTGYGNLFK